MGGDEENRPYSGSGDDQPDDFRKGRDNDASVRKKEIKSGKSRREFLKIMGLGVAGAGLSSAVSGLNFKSDNGFSFFNDSSEDPKFEVKPDGELNGSNNRFSENKIYVDPSEDGEGIQKAADELGSYGGKIELGAGTYYIDAGGVELPPGVSLEGAGKNLTMLRATENHFNNASNSTDALVSSHTTFDGSWDEKTYNGASGKSRRMKISDLSINMVPESLESQDTDDDPLQTVACTFIQNAYDVWIDNVRTLNGVSGIHVRGAATSSSDLNVVTNCDTYRTGQIAIDIGSGGEVVDQGFSVARGNRCINGLSARGTDGFTHGMSVEGSSRVSIVNNVFIDGTFDPENQEWNKVGNWSPALNINDTQNATVTGNVFFGPAVGTNCLDPGAEGKNITITGNTYTRCGGAISVRGSSHNITGNVFENCGHGVQISNTGSAIVSSNVFKDINNHGVRGGVGPSEMINAPVINNNKFLGMNGRLIRIGTWKSNDYAVVSGNKSDQGSISSWPVDVKAQRSSQTTISAITGLPEAVIHR